MKRYTTTALIGLLAATALTSPGCSRRSPDAVFLIVVDTLRPDRLSCYGRKVYTTPYTDSLATEGVVFERAQSVASWTIPSMGAMMTSLYPTQLGLVETPADSGRTFAWRERRDQISLTLAPEDVTLAEMMQKAGYVTAAFVDQPGLNAAPGFAQGFDEYYYPTDIHTIARMDTTTPLEYRKWPPFLQNARDIDKALVSRFDNWLGQHRHEKMFVWVHLLTPHSPYLPPPWARRRTSATKEHWAPITESDDYDGEVIVADELIGHLVDSIDARVGAKRSVVVVTSDHGEEFEEHGMKEHGHSLHSEVVHVPLIVRAPGAPAGVRVKPFVRTIDILPTILELSGASSQLPAGARGESLVGLFDGGGAHRMVYSEGMLYGSTERALTVNGQKLMWDEQGNIYTLFDVLYDPGETVNRIAVTPEIADSLEQALTAMHRELAADFSRRAGTGTPREDAERVRKAMESLGY